MRCTLICCQLTAGAAGQTRRHCSQRANLRQPGSALRFDLQAQARMAQPHLVTAQDSARDGLEMKAVTDAIEQAGEAELVALAALLGGAGRAGANLVEM